MTWNCAGCNVEIDIMDIACIGPGTLKWCEKCKEKGSILAGTLTDMYKEEVITVRVILQMSKDRSCAHK